MSKATQSRRYGKRDYIDLRYLGTLASGNTVVTSTITPETIGQLYQAQTEQKSIIASIANGDAIGSVSMSIVGAASTMAHTWKAVCGSVTITIARTNPLGTASIWTINVQ
jgi:hypothetical protein